MVLIIPLLTSSWCLLPHWQMFLLVTLQTLIATCMPRSACLTIQYRPDCARGRSEVKTMSILREISWLIVLVISCSVMAEDRGNWTGCDFMLYQVGNDSELTEVR